MKWPWSTTTCKNFTFDSKELLIVSGECGGWHDVDNFIKRPAPFIGGVWKVHVDIPDQYPYKSPSIGFVNKIFHPNIDEMCVFSLLNSFLTCEGVVRCVWTWSTRRGVQCLVSLVVVKLSGCLLCSPDMINIFEVFLPQLLRYPNPTDPLNGEAAALLMRDPTAYDSKVKGELYLSTLIRVFSLQTIYRNMQPKLRTMPPKTRTTATVKIWAVWDLFQMKKQREWNYENFEINIWFALLFRHELK